MNKMADEDNKPACKYGTDCYQRNQAHKDRFSHPPKDSAGADHSSSPPLPPLKKRKTTTPSPKSENENDSQSESNDEEEIKPNENENGNANRNGGSSKAQVEKSESAEKKSDTIGSTGSKCSEFIKESFDKGPHAQRAEHQKLLDSPAEFIRAKFLVDMPSEFFTFWHFFTSETSSSKSSPENLFAKLGLKLVGPFDVLAKKFHDIEPFEPGDYLRHWRFYYDPPEFQVKRFYS